MHRDRFLDLESDVTALISEHVLQSDRNRLSFFHEGFFDYGFAGTFVQRDGPPELVLQGEQHLFRRAQVRQILL